MFVELKVISNDECAASKGSIGGYDETYDGQITPNMMCAKDPNQDACQGDSGGPLVVHGHRGPDGSDDVQVGVVSWGIGCAQESFPGVYSRVSKAYEWIREVVCARSADPPASFKCGSPAMTSGSTADNSVSAASAFVSGYQSKSASRTNEVPNWSSLVEDDLKSGYSFFNTGSVDSTLYKSAKGRRGVVRLSNGASISSKVITDTSFDAFRVLVSFYFVNMEEGLGLCIDYSDDKGVSWKESACFRGGSTFTNAVWYDNMTAELSPPEHTESLMIRLRSNGTDGDVLVDKVIVQGLKQ
jgi:trypsin